MQRIVSALFKYILIVIIGLLVLVICSFIQGEPEPQTGEYYYSSFLRNNYTFLSALLFLLTGILIGYFFKLNPWFSGIALILIFPLVSFYEATVYRGSHNLIPFELIIHFLFALPGVVGAFIGKLIFNRSKTTEKIIR